MAYWIPFVHPENKSCRFRVTLQKRFESDFIDLIKVLVSGTGIRTVEWTIRHLHVGTASIASKVRGKFVQNSSIATQTLMFLVLAYRITR